MSEAMTIPPMADAPANDLRAVMNAAAGLNKNSTTAAMSSAREASAVKAVALPPSDAMMPAVSSAAAAFRSTQNTCAPWRAKVTAVALPLPQPGPIEPAPTTIAVFPLRRPTRHLRLPSKLTGRKPMVNPSQWMAPENRSALARTPFPAYCGAREPVRQRPVLSWRTP